jgi:hypothetical protein
MDENYLKKKWMKMCLWKLLKKLGLQSSEVLDLFYPRRRILQISEKL